MADYITTYSKIHFSMLEPEKNSIEIQDIAHALSLMTRANGHFPEFYSVAQHCIACAQEAEARNLSPRIQLACLLHDASEAYLSDITRPVKRNLEPYIEIEKRLQEMIYGKYLNNVLTPQERAMVEDVDDSLLYHEFLFYMEETLLDSPPKLESTPVFAWQPFKEVEKLYLNSFFLLFS